MQRYRLTLAYDGSDFRGWQLQHPEQAPRTVQGTLEAALLQLSGEAVRVAAAGRTDTGVHAEGQVVSFDLGSDLDPERILRSLNGLLPRDVRVREVDCVPVTFHARRSALGKLYRYVLDTGPVQLPTRCRSAGHSPWLLDHDAVRAAARLFLGRQDFASLASAGGGVSTTTRTITRSEVSFDGPAMTYEVEADGFLRKMVRSLVGGLIAVGRGTRSVEGLQEALGARDRRAWPAPAAARGLTLVRVDYPPLE